MSAFSMTKNAIIKLIQSMAGSGGGVESVTAGTGISITGTATEPIINATGGGLLLETKTLNDAQIKVLPSTPFEIIPAPGANKIIVPVSALFILDTLAAAYTSDADSAWNLRWGTDSETASQIIPINAILNQQNIGFGHWGIPYADNGSGSFANVVTNVAFSNSIINKSIVITDGWMGVTNYTGGNAANTLKIYVYYIIMDV